MAEICGIHWLHMMTLTSLCTINYCILDDSVSGHVIPLNVDKILCYKKGIR